MVVVTMKAIILALLMLLTVGSPAPCRNSRKSCKDEKRISVYAVAAVWLTAALIEFIQVKLAKRK